MTAPPTTDRSAVVQSIAEALRNGEKPNAAQLAKAHGKSQRWGYDVVKDARKIVQPPAPAQSEKSTAKKSASKPAEPASAEQGSPQSAVQGKPEAVPATPLTVRLCMSFGLFAVVAVSFGVSFTHQYVLAAEHGGGWWSWGLPVYIDGMLLTSSVFIAVRRAAGRKIPPFAVLGAVIGLAGSIAANFESAPADLISRVIAVAAPVALFITSEVFLQFISDGRKS